ncbi:AAA family ATPase [Pseudomonas kulmbachensis]|uniref:AAA family ATPase n=1 Tax=Pseudomonas kulmbachensis TaxID=3043408 RepID=UPI002AAF36F1|nr:AAA family ATPase [Pseudomonas sp. V3/3/4/13]
MRICFIWVSGFKNLRNFGINLCNDFKFSYNPISGDVKRTKQLPLPPEIFGKNIHDITAILGINGAGKSNALQLICLALKSNDKLDTPLLIVYESNDQLFYINNTEGYVKPDFVAEERNDHRDFKDLNVVYFSNVFDENQLDLGKNVQDISANLRYNRTYYGKEKLKPKHEIIDQLSFIYSDVYHHVKIDTPKTLEIKVDRLIRDRLISEREHPFYNILKEILDLQQEFRKRSTQNKDLLAAVAAVQGLFLFQILRENLECDELRKLIEDTLKQKDSDTPSLKKLLFITKTFFEQSKTLPTINYPIQLTELIEVAINLEPLFYQMNVKLDTSVKSSRYIFTLDFSKHENLPYLQLAWIIERIRSGTMVWTGISSGQKAYLNMFSSIWSTLSNPHSAKKISSSTLLCIDEADLYLHPQWQIEFIERLITCLPSLSNGRKQIVITTHSPILVSDLPSQCLIALSPPQTEHVKESPATDDLKTFGANLFDIYSAAFGLNGQRTGNLSSKYISKILAILDCDDITPPQREALIQAASIIDDELINAHILKRIYSK